MYPIRFSLLALLIGSVVACAPGDERILGIDATGTVAGLVFLDRDGDGNLDPEVDAPAPGARVALLVRGTSQVAARATAGPDGGYLMRSVPVGSYSVALDSVTLGDSLRVLRVEPDEVVVLRDDTLIVTVAAGRTTIPIAEARQARPGRRVSVDAVAHHAWGTFGDSTLHVADTSGVIRAIQVANPGIAVGDSVRLVGTVAIEEGQPTLVAPTVVVLGRGQLRAPVTVATAAAATAAGGRLDAALVRIASGTIIDARPTGEGDLRLRVDDGSGTVDVIIDRNAQITSEVPTLPGAQVDVTGVLVPGGDGSWRVKPRSTRDLKVTVPPVSLAEVRRLSPGRLVSVEAVALNGWATFGDANLHLADGTGYALAVRVPPTFVFAGDRVRLYGVVSTFNGSPAIQALENTPPFILGKGQLPAPVPVSTRAAAEADGGRLDAALVRVTGATVADTASLGGDFVLRVDDGSGPLDILLETEAGVASSVHPPGAVLDVTGLLTPLPGGRVWVLRPRSREDISRR